jgi:serine/threonine protein phosphatase PrpC
MPELCKYGYQAAAASHRGRVRTANEDSFGICANEGLFVVCDGMGGAAAGEVASRVAVDTMLRCLCTPQKTTPTKETDPGPIEPRPDTGVPAMLRNAVSDANHLVFSQAANDARLHGMGTTLVALLTQQNKAWIAHVGDSRCYRYRAGVLEQLTRDHSLVDEQVKLGQLTREEADRSPLRNVITRAVGSQRSVTAEVNEVETAPGDLFLLCSDGLTRELPDARIESILNETDDLDRICQRLIDSANDAGGRDNVTCIVVRAVPSS